VFDPIDVSRVLGSGAAGVLAYQLGKALVVWVQGKADVARIRANGEVLTNLAKLEPDQVERLHAHLERVPPASSDAIEPPGPDP
jgi:hypothetical protein